jgi:hypothetical protein
MMHKQLSEMSLGNWVGLLVYVDEGLMVYKA